MKILFYLIKIYFNNLFVNINRLVTLFLSLTIAVFYAFIVFVNEINIDDYFVKIVLLSIFFFNLFTTSIPQKIINIRCSEPKWKIFLFNFFWSEILSILFFTYSLFVIALCLFQVINLQLALNLAIVIVFGFLLRRLIQLLLLFNFKKEKCLLVFFIFVINALCIISFFYTPIELYRLLFILSVSFLSTFLIEEYFSSPMLKDNSNSFGIQNIVYANKTLRLIIIISFVAKIFFLGLITSLYFEKGKYPPYFIIILFSSPLLLFNYVFGNIFGYLPKFWITIQRVKDIGSVKFFFIYLKIFYLPIVIDLLITVVFAYLNSSIMKEVLMTYFVLLLTFIPLNLMSSLYFPLKINKNIFANKTTSFFSVMLNMTIMGLLFLMYMINEIFFYLFSIICVITSNLIILNLNKIIKSTKHIVYNKLFK